MTHERLCGPQRQPCPNPWKCSPTFCHFTDLNTASDTGHKVAHGKRTDYFGKAAQCPAELPVVMFDQYPSYIRWLDGALNWCDRNRFWAACVMTGAAIGFGWGLGRLLKLF